MCSPRTKVPSHSYEGLNHGYRCGACEGLGVDWTGLGVDLTGVTDWAGRGVAYWWCGVDWTGLSVGWTGVIGVRRH